MEEEAPKILERVELETESMAAVISIRRECNSVCGSSRESTYGNMCRRVVELRVL